MSQARVAAVRGSAVAASKVGGSAGQAVPPRFRSISHLTGAPANQYRGGWVDTFRGTVLTQLLANFNQQGSSTGWTYIDYNAGPDKWDISQSVRRQWGINPVFDYGRAMSVLRHRDSRVFMGHPFLGLMRRVREVNHDYLESDQPSTVVPKLVPGFKYLPGTAALIKPVMRAQDRAILVEKDPEYFRRLQDYIGRDHRFKLYNLDVYEEWSSVMVKGGEHNQPISIPQKLKRSQIVMKRYLEELEELKKIGSIHPNAALEPKKPIWTKTLKDESELEKMRKEAEAAVKAGKFSEPAHVAAEKAIEFETNQTRAILQFMGLQKPDLIAEAKDGMPEKRAPLYIPRPTMQRADFKTDHEYTLALEIERINGTLARREAALYELTQGSQMAPHLYAAKARLDAVQAKMREIEAWHALPLSEVEFKQWLRKEYANDPFAMEFLQERMAKIDDDHELVQVDENGEAVDKQQAAAIEAEMEEEAEEEEEEDEDERKEAEEEEEQLEEMDDDEDAPDQMRDMDEEFDRYEAYNDLEDLRMDMLKKEEMELVAIISKAAEKFTRVHQPAGLEREVELQDWKLIRGRLTGLKGFENQKAAAAAAEAMQLEERLESNLLTIMQQLDTFEFSAEEKKELEAQKKELIEGRRAVQTQVAQALQSSVLPANAAQLSGANLKSAIAKHDADQDKEWENVKASVAKDATAPANESKEACRARMTRLASARELFQQRSQLVAARRARDAGVAPVAGSVALARDQAEAEKLVAANKVSALAQCKFELEFEFEHNPFFNYETALSNMFDPKSTGLLRSKRVEAFLALSEADQLNRLAQIAKDGSERELDRRILALSVTQHEALKKAAANLPALPGHSVDPLVEALVSMGVRRADDEDGASLAERAALIERLEAQRAPIAAASRDQAQKMLDRLKDAPNSGIRTQLASDYIEAEELYWTMLHQSHTPRERDLRKAAQVWLQQSGKDSQKANKAFRDVIAATHATTAELESALYDARIRASNDKGVADKDQFKPTEQSELPVKSLKEARADLRGAQAVAEVAVESLRASVLSVSSNALVNGDASVKKLIATITATDASITEQDLIELDRLKKESKEEEEDDEEDAELPEEDEKIEPSQAAPASGVSLLLQHVNELLVASRAVYTVAQDKVLSNPKFQGDESKLSASERAEFDALAASDANLESLELTALQLQKSVNDMHAARDAYLKVQARLAASPIAVNKAQEIAGAELDEEDLALFEGDNDAAEAEKDQDLQQAAADFQALKPEEDVDAPVEAIDLLHDKEDGLLSKDKDEADDLLELEDDVARQDDNDLVGGEEVNAAAAEERELSEEEEEELLEDEMEEEDLEEELEASQEIAASDAKDQKILELFRLTESRVNQMTPIEFVNWQIAGLEVEIARKNAELTHRDVWNREEAVKHVVAAEQAADASVVERVNKKEPVSLQELELFLYRAKISGRFPLTFSKADYKSVRLANPYLVEPVRDLDAMMKEAAEAALLPEAIDEDIEDEDDDTPEIWDEDEAEMMDLVDRDADAPPADFNLEELKEAVMDEFATDPLKHEIDEHEALERTSTERDLINALNTDPLGDARDYVKRYEFLQSWKPNNPTEQKFKEQILAAMPLDQEEYENSKDIVETVKKNIDAEQEDGAISGIDVEEELGVNALVEDAPKAARPAAVEDVDEDEEDDEDDGLDDAQVEAFRADANKFVTPASRVRDAYDLVAREFERCEADLDRITSAILNQTAGANAQELYDENVTAYRTAKKLLAVADAHGFKRDVTTRFKPGKEDELVEVDEQLDISDNIPTFAQLTKQAEEATPAAIPAATGVQKPVNDANASAIASSPVGSFFDVAAVNASSPASSVEKRQLAAVFAAYEEALEAEVARLREEATAIVRDTRAPFQPSELDIPENATAAERLKLTEEHPALVKVEQQEYEDQGPEIIEQVVGQLLSERYARIQPFLLRKKQMLETLKDFTFAPYRAALTKAGLKEESSTDFEIEQKGLGVMRDQAHTALSNLLEENSADLEARLAQLQGEFERIQATRFAGKFLDPSEDLDSIQYYKEQAERQAEALEERKKKYNELINGEDLTKGDAGSDFVMDGFKKAEINLEIEETRSDEEDELAVPDENGIMYEKDLLQEFPLSAKEELAGFSQEEVDIAFKSKELLGADVDGTIIQLTTEEKAAQAKLGEKDLKDGVIPDPQAVNPYDLPTTHFPVSLAAALARPLTSHAIVGIDIAELVTEGIGEEGDILSVDDSVLAATTQILNESVQRFPHATYLISYPIFGRGYQDQLLHACMKTGVRNIIQGTFHIQKGEPFDTASRVYDFEPWGVGVVVIRPPPGFEKTLKDIVNTMQDVLIAYGPSIHTQEESEAIAGRNFPTPDSQANATFFVDQSIHYSAGWPNRPNVSWMTQQVDDHIKNLHSFKWEHFIPNFDSARSKRFELVAKARADLESDLWNYSRGFKGEQEEANRWILQNEGVQQKQKNKKTSKPVPGAAAQGSGRHAPPPPAKSDIKDPLHRYTKTSESSAIRSVDWGVVHAQDRALGRIADEQLSVARDEKRTQVFDMLTNFQKIKLQQEQLAQKEALNQPASAASDASETDTVDSKKTKKTRVTLTELMAQDVEYQQRLEEQKNKASQQ